MKKNNKNKKIYTTILSNILIWILIVVVAIGIANTFSPFEKNREVSYSEYKILLENS